MCFDLTKGREGAANLIIKNVDLEPEVLFSSQITALAEKEGAQSAYQSPAAEHRLCTHLGWGTEHRGLLVQHQITLGTVWTMKAGQQDGCCLTELLV